MIMSNKSSKNWYLHISYKMWTLIATNDSLMAYNQAIFGSIRSKFIGIFAITKSKNIGRAMKRWIASPFTEFSICFDHVNKLLYAKYQVTGNLNGERPWATKTLPYFDKYWGLFYLPTVFSNQKESSCESVPKGVFWLFHSWSEKRQKGSWKMP